VSPTARRPAASAPPEVPALETPPAGGEARRPRRGGRRHRSREAALQMLYACEVAGLAPEAAAAVYWAEQAPRPPLGAAHRAFAESLVQGTVAHRAAIDAHIDGVVEHWRPERLALVDRLILRLAAYELLYGGETPAPVVIDEALELARTFSTEESVAFVNGVLDGLRKRVAGPHP
jgi:N utilization substance protein B